VQNIVASFKVNFKIDLIAFNMSRPLNSFYDPTIFPGLKFKPYVNEKMVALIFISGKIVVTGIQEVEKINDIKDYVSKILLRYKRSFPYLTL
jgi:TATA-box binding protein (TBP) (component of TFIID and TFIIIB)